MPSAYDVALLPLRAAAELWAAWHARGPRREETRERLARRLPPHLPGAVWIHGASVGEARLVGALARALRGADAGRALVVSALTPTGRAALPAPPAVEHAFVAPLDFGGLPGRVLSALDPAALVLVETELWPNLLRAAAERRVPVVVANGRLSERRMARYRRIAFALRPGLAAVARVGAGSNVDAERFAEVGVPRDRIRVTGNLKFDLPAPATPPAVLREELGLGAERPVLVAGSTAAGEDGAVLGAFLAVRAGRDAALLVLAPRHPDRADAVEAEVVRAGLRPARLSRAPRLAAADVLLVDTLGRLADLWQLGAAAFVGGSLVPVGGHNVLEPAAAGVPVAFGPHTANVDEPARALEASGGGRRVRDAAGLAAFFTDMLDDPAGRSAAVAAAVRVIETHRGALARTVDLVLETIRAPRANGAG